MLKKKKFETDNTKETTISADSETELLESPTAIVEVALTQRNGDVNKYKDPANLIVIFVEEIEKDGVEGLQQNMIIQGDARLHFVATNKLLKTLLNHLPPSALAELMSGTIDDLWEEE